MPRSPMGSDANYSWFFAGIVLVMCVVWGVGVGAYLVFRSRSAVAREADAAAERERIRRRLHREPREGAGDDPDRGGDARALPGRDVGGGRAAADDAPADHARRDGAA